MESNMMARDIFREYRIRTERNVMRYNSLKTFNPYYQLPKLAAHIWRMSALAEAWGLIAMRIDGRNYLEEWRTGR